MFKNIWFLIVSTLLVSSASYAADNVLDIKDDKSNSLNFSKFNQKYGGWSEVEYSSANNNFKLYAVPTKMDPVESGVVASSDEESMSPDKKYLLLQRTRAGEIVDEQGNSVLSAQAYCDMVSLESGCVKNIGSAQQCDGTWDGQNWKVSTGEIFDFTKGGISPKQLLSKISSLSPDDARSSSIREWLFMGVASYTACYPPEKNVAELNDIAFYLAKGGEHLVALQIYTKLASVAPDRIPLKLNIADSLWAAGKLVDAKSYYADYQSAMKKNGDEKKIPKRVELRSQ